jgi:hypothetical protein
MNDEEAYKLIEDFANSTSVAIGGNIIVTHDYYSTGFKPRPPATWMKSEDTNYLSSIINGAQHLLWHLRREGYTIKKSRKRK